MGEEEGARRASVARAIAHASERPCRPVTAFAQPLLTTRARARPAVWSRTALETVTGAAWNALRVKLAAAEVGRDEVEEDGEVEHGCVLFYAAVYATEEVAAREEVVKYRFVEVRFGRGGFGGECRRS